MISRNSPVTDTRRLHWSRLERGDDEMGATAERSLKFILGAREFGALSRCDDSRAGYYRATDGLGNAITVRVVADDVAA